MTFTKKAFYLSIIPTLISCAGIKPRNNPHHHAYKPTPTQQINVFEDETKKITLQKVIETEKEPEKAKEFFLQTKDHKQIKFWENYFTGKGKKSFEIFLNNGQKYKSIITKIFREHNLPEDLYYVGLIESGYKNHARSHAGAVGPWQFIKGTATRYGLKVNRYIDERKNIYKSTQAAALYFQDLYNIFGSWELALSAYNAGEYGVIRRIRGANTRDFYELSKKKILPKETRNYVPKIIAAMNIDHKRDLHHIRVRATDDSFYSEVKSYQVSKKITVRKLANKLKINSTTIKALNHDIKGATIPYASKGYEIYLPTKIDGIGKIIAENDSSQVKETHTTPKRAIKNKKSYQTKTHRVQKNESLYSISRRYGINVNTLKKLNNLKSNTIYLGQKLKVKSQAKTKVHYSYIVQKGDHLSHLATVFNTKIIKLKKMNKLRKSQIRVGQKLKVPAHKKKYYTVKRGDVLTNIARKNKISLSGLKKLNKINKNRIYPGQKLLVELSTL